MVDQRVSASDPRGPRPYPPNLTRRALPHRMSEEPQGLAGRLVSGQRAPASREARLARRSGPDWGLSLSTTGELQRASSKERSSRSGRQHAVQQRCVEQADRTHGNEGFHPVWAFMDRQQNAGDDGRCEEGGSHPECISDGAPTARERVNSVRPENKHIKGQEVEGEHTGDCRDNERCDVVARASLHSNETKEADQCGGKCDHARRDGSLGVGPETQCRKECAAHDGEDREEGGGNWTNDRSTRIRRARCFSQCVSHHSLILTEPPGERW